METEPDKDDAEKEDSDKGLLKTATDRLQECIDNSHDERAKQLDDLKFSTLEQWPEDIRNTRENDTTGARPCLTIDKINQYITQVVNDIRQNRPSGKVRPVDDKSDPDTAKVFQNVIREIEDESSAPIAYETAAESAVRVGEGYFRFITDYENERSDKQVIKVKRVPSMFSVHLGPHNMPDGSDAEYGFVFEDMPTERFKREYPGKKFEATDFDGLEEGWVSEKTVRVAEYFYPDYKKEKLVFTADGKTLTQEEYDELPEPRPEIMGGRDTQIKSMKWCKLTGAEILEKEDWAGKYVPIVKVIGKESLVEGKRVVWGLVRPAKDSLRMYNYWASTITEKMALSPKTPYIGAVGQFEGVEDTWDKANTTNFSRLEYKPIDINGVAVPPPQRQPPAPLESAMIQQLQIIEHDVQTSLGMFKAALGQEQPQQSGKAILALTRESDTGTYHFAANLGISVNHGYRIMLDLIPKIYDTKRILRMLGEDGEIDHAQIDPEQETAVRAFKDMEGKIKKIYNLGVGTYDVTVTTGPSYTTRRMEAAATFTDLANSAKDPMSAAVVRYLAVKNSDFDGADEAVDMLKKLLPQQVLGDGSKPQLPPEVMQQMEMMKQAIQELGQENQQLKSGAQEAQAKIQVESQEGMAKIAADREEAMAALALKREIQAEELRLKRERDEAEIALKSWVAQQEIAIKKATALANAEIAEKAASQQTETTE